jgi:hypothetical protein
MEDDKCKIPCCNNRKSQGEFIGDLCTPCYKYLYKGEGIYSQAFRNSKRINENLIEIENLKNRIIVLQNEINKLMIPEDK